MMTREQIEHGLRNATMLLGIAADGGIFPLVSRHLFEQARGSILAGLAPFADQQPEKAKLRPKLTVIEKE